MKKRSIWILALSALLCLSILFSACSPAESEGDPAEDGSDIFTETEDIPQDEVVDYRSILDEWGKYLKAVGKDTTDDVYDTNEILVEDIYGDDVSVSVEVYGTIAKVISTKSEMVDAEGNLISPASKTVSYYDLKTKELICSKAQSSWNTELSRYDIDYSTNVLFDTIIEIISINWSVDTNGVWNQERTYSYYMPDGTLIASGLKKAAKVFSDVKAVEIIDTTYHCRDGKVIHKSSIGGAHQIPAFRKEYGDYRYSIGNGALQVHDSNYTLVVNYKLPDHIALNDYKVFVLSDGSVYFNAIEKCLANEERYDFEDEDGVRYRVWHLIVDLTGKETTIDAPFVISGESSNGGLISNFNTEETGIELFGNYQYAEIVRIEDGVLANDVDFVILDNKLEEVATLPKILKNQLSIKEGLENGRLIVIADNILGTESRYIADATKGTVARFFNSGVAYSEIDGGFVFDGKVYGNDLKEVHEFENAVSYHIYDGVVYYVESDYIEVPVYPEDTTDPSDTDTGIEETEYDTDYVNDEIEYEMIEIRRHYIGYVDENGLFLRVELGSDVTVRYIGGGLFAVGTDEAMLQIYNKYGELVSFDSGYSLSTVSLVKEYEDGMVIRAKQSYMDVNGFEVPVKYTYYIVK